MGTTTSIAISAAANAAAQEAARKACMAMVRGYEHDRASIAEMREYAGCIDRLHPAPLTEEGLGIAKAAVLVLFIATIAGVFWEKRERMLGNTWVSAICGGSLIGLLAGVCGLLAIAGVWLGIQLLLK